MNFSIANLTRFTLDALERAGVKGADAQITADVLVTTDAWGVFTHGTKALRNYIRRLRAGGLKPDGKPRVLGEGPAWAIVDGDSSLGMVTSSFATRVAIEKARTAGTAFVGVRNSCHFGAAGYYAYLAAKEGMIGFAMANDIPTVTGPGALGPVLGSNPFGFAAPAGREYPIVLDMATSTVAGGKVFAAAALGQSIPDHWMVDAKGNASTDPTLFNHAGSLTPLGGYKGYGIALMIEILSAVLTQAAITNQVVSWSYGDASAPTGHGASFVVINPSLFLPLKDFTARMDHLIDELHKLPKRPGVEKILVPGEREWEMHKKAKSHGIDFPADVDASLKTLAGELGLDLARYTS